MEIKNEAWTQLYQLEGPLAHVDLADSARAHFDKVIRGVIDGLTGETKFGNHIEPSFYSWTQGHVARSADGMSDPSIMAMPCAFVLVCVTDMEEFERRVKALSTGFQRKIMSCRAQWVKQSEQPQNAY